VGAGGGRVGVGVVRGGRGGAVRAGAAPRGPAESRSHSDRTVPPRQ